MGGKPLSHSCSGNCSRTSSGTAPVPSSVLVNEMGDGTASSEWEAGLRALVTGITL